MEKLNHFQKFKSRYEKIGLCIFFLINSTILATSVVMEAQRANETLPFQLWEPFIWEYASAIGTLVVFPALVFFLGKYPFNWQAIKRSLLVYFLASFVFSLIHIGIMVAIKEVVYALNSIEYEFGDFWFEMLYEYRKDLWSFCTFILLIHGYKFITSRLLGEANPIQEGEVSETKPEIDRLLVKKLGKEFIIKVKDVEWLESAGNYVNLHIEHRIYPLRTTLTKFSEQIESKGFCRIHRSYAVNLSAVESITPLSSGDSEVKLITGKTLNLSRRYKDAFKAKLS